MNLNLNSTLLIKLYLTVSNTRDPYRLEQELRRLKAELQNSRQSEQELRSHVCNLTNSERSLRPEVSLLRQSNMLLQSK